MPFNKICHAWWMFIENNIINVSQYEAICLPVIAPKKEKRRKIHPNRTMSPKWQETREKNRSPFRTQCSFAYCFLPFLRVPRKRVKHIHKTHCIQIGYMCPQYDNSGSVARATFKPSNRPIPARRSKACARIHARTFSFTCISKSMRFQLQNNMWWNNWK